MSWTVSQTLLIWQVCRMYLHVCTTMPTTYGMILASESSVGLWVTATYASVVLHHAIGQLEGPSKIRQTHHFWQGHLSTPTGMSQCSRSAKRLRCAYRFICMAFLVGVKRIGSQASECIDALKWQQSYLDKGVKSLMIQSMKNMVAIAQKLVCAGTSAHCKAFGYASI